ncbi:putative leucine-rich repeat-containing, plant-type, leucine-rich repeat domain, L [Medicago truncatula]|uniref:Putative leucine-rich repeat-containing, plant-type, leucine-rich repeat domain, L n=1 Tax=Medicago truncatula TaxID=3880 RepID=A0A396HI42_MEDTR|nr:putative leucine-rich repeat-containing, plant-type, leucine-rich repeat domain, L [Medicago truncatula]
MAWLLLLLHLFLFHFPSFSSFNFSCHRDESSALLQFKSSFTINSESSYPCDESLLKTATWKYGTDCCSWHGVTCDTTFGRVIGLNLGCEGLQGNNLGGFLPKAYLRNYEAMKNVTQVDGDISLQYLHKSYEKFDAGYSDSVTVATKGIQMKLVKIPIKFVSIDFSRNKFEGEIPNAIGELHALKGLNLSHNRLTGHIPKSIGNLTYLESLDLSLNMLTGVIPAELTNLNFLEVMNLSNNHLVGEIPRGKQFNTFTNDSYEGNLGLCGFPLSKRCGLEQHSPPSPNKNFWSEEKFGFGWIPVVIGYGCGFLIGIGIGYCMFLVGKPRWLVMIFGGQPKRKVKKRTRMRRNHGTAMNQNQNQMMQMS